MVAWNPQIFIFGWREDFLMGISSVDHLFFKGQMVPIAIGTCLLFSSVFVY
jgi:hypothetical protein